MNTETYVNPAEQQLREVVDRLRAEGWHVVTEPAPNGLPGPLRGARVDFVASRDQDIVIGEVASRGTARQERIDALAKQVAAVPNARLEVYWTGDTPTTKPNPDVVRQYIAQAHAVTGISLQAALLMAVAGFEAAVATFADKTGISFEVPAKQLLSNLYSLGYVDDIDFDRLNRLFALRNAIAHSATAQTPELEDIEFCLDLARRMLDGRYVSADQMIEWFEERFEGPEHHVPFDSREGGYQYGNEGPYDADDVLREQFPYASEQAIIDAVSWIERKGHEWVSKAALGDFSEE